MHMDTLAAKMTVNLDRHSGTYSHEGPSAEKAYRAFASDTLHAQYKHSGLPTTAQVTEAAKAVALMVEAGILKARKLEDPEYGYYVKISKN